MRISLDHNILFLKSTFLILVNLQAVRSVASSGKFYRLRPYKENTGKRNNIHLWKDQLQGHALVAPMAPGTLLLLLRNYSRTFTSDHLSTMATFLVLVNKINNPYIDSCLNLCTMAASIMATLLCPKDGFCGEVQL